MGLTASHRARWTSWNYFRFVFPSLIGVFLFLCPVKYGSELTIPVGILANELRWAIGEFMATFTTCIFVSGAIFTALFNLRSTQLNGRFPQLHTLFSTNWTWFALRILGGLLALLTFLELGPEWIIGAKTGRTAYIDIAGIIFCILGVASLLLPLLTDFGFLEFVGAIMRGVFQATFNLPGRATVDTLASWVGASSVAVLVTIRQYQAGFYSVREACVIRYKLFCRFHSIRGAYSPDRRHRRSVHGSLWFDGRYWHCLRYRNSSVAAFVPTDRSLL